MPLPVPIRYAISLSGSLLVLGLILAPPPSAAQDLAPASASDGETALFLGAGFSAPLAGGVRVNSLNAIAIGEIEGDFASLNLSYKPHEKITLAGGYFGFFEGPTPDRPDPFDHRIRLDATLRWPLGKFVVQHRQRFEYRFRDLPDGWRWRPEVRLERPFSLTGWRTYRPYIGLEPFYEFNTTTLTAFLVEAGTVVPLTRRLSVVPGYLGVVARNGVADLHFVTAFFTYRFGQ